MGDIYYVVNKKTMGMSSMNVEMICVEHTSRDRTLSPSNALIET